MTRTIFVGSVPEEMKKVYDLVFMDVEMPFMDGLKTAKKLREKDSQVVLVFVTKLFQYAVNGYEYDAADYIIKPIRPNNAIMMSSLNPNCCLEAIRKLLKKEPKTGKK